MSFLESKKITTFAVTTLVTFGVLICIFIGLPALFKAIDIPSFRIGYDNFWLLNWQNDSEGFGIEFNLVPLLIAALTAGLVSLLIQRRSSEKSNY